MMIIDFHQILILYLKAGALLFNAGYNEQVLLLNPEKNLAQIRFVVFEQNAKKHTNSEN